MEAERKAALQAKVEAIFARLCGMDTSEAAGWSDLCGLALERMLRALRIQPPEGDPLWESILYAAAADAGYRQSLAAGTVTGAFSLADLSVEEGQSGGGEGFLTLYRRCLEDLAPYLRDGAFYFKGV